MTTTLLARRRLILAGLGALAGLGPKGAAGARPQIRRDAIPFERAVVDGDGQTGQIVWSAPPSAGAVTVFAHLSPDGEASAPVRLVGQGGPAGALDLPVLPPATRWFFELRPDYGASLMIADRSLHLRTAPNFRDVGGYRTADGRWVRMGLAYRSDQLDHLSDADLETVARLRPVLVADLRTQGERRAGPDRLPQGSEALVADVMASAPPDAAAILHARGPEDAADFLASANRQFVSGASALLAYHSLMTRLGAPGGVSVYHCTAGKDRTGWGSAVLLTILGVPPETVMEDYLASNRYLAEKNAALFAVLPPDRLKIMETVMTVRAEYLEAAFNEVRRGFGSFDSYLAHGLRLDAGVTERLRARFLVGAPAA